MHKRLAKIVVFVAAMLMLSMPSLAQSDGFIRYPITTDPEHLNPFISDTIAIGTVTRNIYEGLVRYNAETGEVEPAIAETWELSNDAEGRQVYTFTLRQGVLFHELAGLELMDREVTADDILWNYMVALNADEDISIRAAELDMILGAAEYTAALQERVDAGEEVPLIDETLSVPGLAVVDDYTFQITLSAPDRLFLLIGAGMAITSPEAYESLGEAFNSTPVGTGPYRFVEWLRQDRLIIEANPDYYVDGLPANAGIRFINYGDANTALLDYRENNLDFLFSFPSGQRTAVITEFPEDFREKPGLHLRYWGFNMETGFLAENKLVRQALSHTLDRVTAWDIFEEGARFPASLGMLVPAMPASTPATIYDFDLTKAQELLAEAGFPNGEGLPVMKIHLLESISGEAQVVVWQEALQSIGVQVEFIIEDGSTYWDSIVTDEAMIFQNGWAAGLIDPSDVFDFLILDGRGSMRYDNPAVNDLLRAARLELDETARLDLYQQAHDIIMDDAVVIPSAYSKVTWLQKAWVDGFIPGGGGTYTAPMWNVVLNG
jgi:ABC-type transport system substrate-binding protein